VKLYHLVLGLSLIGAGTAVSFATDSTTPATGAAPATQTAPATTTAPADSSTPATPATSTTPATTGETAAAGQPDPNEKICKKDEMTGSRLGKVCKTRKEWDEEAKGGGSDF
jgi:hypothetical protein